MSKPLKPFLLLIACLLPTSLLANVTLPQGLEKVLNKAGVPSSAVGLVVRRLDQKQARISLNADKPLNPASVIKIVTTLAALETLGPHYTWRTQALIEGRRQGDTIKGNLILRGEGDPYFTPDALWQLMSDIRAHGIRHIDGDVLLDASYFAPISAKRGDFDGEPHRAYNALPYALSLNFQAVQLTVTPDNDNGNLQAFPYPPLDNLVIENKARYTPGACKSGRQAPQVKIIRSNGVPTVKLSGRMAANCRKAVFDYLVNTPEEQIAGTFRSIWNQLGGTIQGDIKPGMAGKSAKLLTEQKSRPLAHAVWGVNKYSNNLMARHILLTLAAEKATPPATAKQGVQAVTSWLKRAGINRKNFHMENGAGLSRDTRITTKTLGEVLAHGYQGPRMPEFLASLPVVGVDGTTRLRLRKHPVKGRAHIKTGSIDHVSAMGGYVLDKKGRRWLVAMMINHKKLRWYGRAAQDAVLSWVYKGAR